MPSHLIADAHEWSNVILTVPICDSAKPLPGNGLGDDKGEMSPNVLDFIQTLRIDSIGVEYVGEATRS